MLFFRLLHYFFLINTVIYGEFNGDGYGENYAINCQFGEGNWQTQRLGGQHGQFRGGNWQNGQNRAQSRSEVNTLTSQGGGANHRQAASNSCDQILKNSSSAIEQLIKGKLINPIEHFSGTSTFFCPTTNIMPKSTAELIQFHWKIQCDRKGNPNLKSHTWSNS